MLPISIQKNYPPASKVSREFIEIKHKTILPTRILSTLDVVIHFKNLHGDSYKLLHCLLLGIIWNFQNCLKFKLFLYYERQK